MISIWKAALQESLKIALILLLSIIAGIGISIFSLAKIITWLLTRPPYSGLVLLLRIGTCFHLVRFQRYQEMGLENDPELYHRDRYCILHNGCDTSRDTFQPVLYLPLRSDSHLCHDPAGVYRGSFHFSAVRQIFLYHGGGKDIQYSRNVSVYLRCGNRYHQFLPCAFVRSPPVPRHLRSPYLAGFMLGSLNKGLALEGNDRDLYGQPRHCKAFSRSQHHAESTCLGSCRPDGFSYAIVYFLEKLSMKTSK